MLPVVNGRSSTRTRAELCWFEPQWSYVPDAKKAVAFTGEAGFWLRGIILPYALFVLIVATFLRWIPELISDLPEILLRGAVAVLAVVVILRYLTPILPQIVTVNKWGLR